MYDYFKKLNDMRLYNYFKTMISLISLMCIQRNYKGINILQGLYNLEFAIDCFLDSNIQPTLRANLAKLLISTHIDKDPLEEISVPILTRVWHEIAAEKTTIPSSRAKVHPKLLDLKNFVVSFFETMQGV